MEKMKPIFVVLALVIFCVLPGCRSYDDGYSDGYEAGLDSGYEEGLSAGFDSGYHEGYDDGQFNADCSDVEETISEYEAKIEYYEILCDYYGYHTYESVYYPELWCNYFPEDSNIYHNDWLCPEFDNTSSYFISADSWFYEELENYVLCDICGGCDICFLDVNTNIFHSKKSHLELGTEDYITSYGVYRFVREETAIANGFTPCDYCFQE